MKIALDIRPALRAGTGVGTVVEELALALDAAEGNHELRLFTSSFKDRWDPKRLNQLKRSKIIDAKWPVKLLNPLWHWVGLPKVESFVGPVDIAHSPTPLIMPTNAKRIITLNDLYFFTRNQSDNGRKLQHAFHELALAAVIPNPNPVNHSGGNMLLHQNMHNQGYYKIHGTILPDLAEAIKHLHGLIQPALDAAYDAGKSDGHNLLGRLASGDIAPNEFFKA